ncbi:hypothetical protein [Sinorhizobium chiapasense]|uniref:Uncharacterized protein n=1 Tax=Sinorhizobium chiapasense TaxID=501572 RepID=A0ABZ2BAR4_9HYPH
MVQRFDQSKAIETLEILAGERPRSRDQAAVRIEDLAELLQIEQFQTSEVSAAPTAADFNSLRGDILEIHTRITVIAQVLRDRIIR